MSYAAASLVWLKLPLPKSFYIAECRPQYSNQRNMFVNKWTVQLSGPGQIVEQAFDSKEELLAFVRRMERESSDGVRPTISEIGRASCRERVESAVSSE